MDETRVRGLLQRAAASQGPPSQVDVEFARSQGRRKLRWRRATLAGVSAAAVVAVVVAAVAVPGSGHAPSGRGRAPEAARGQVIAPRQFSLSRPYAVFGWLPKGESLNEGLLAPQLVSLTAGSDLAWTLTVYPRGFCDLSREQVLRQLGRHEPPRLSCSHSGIGMVFPVASVAAGRVDGHAAFWTAGQTYLVWQYAAGAWAALASHDGAGPGVAIKIASGVRYGAPGPSVKYPVQLVNVPPKWTLGYVHFMAKSGVLRAFSYGLAEANSPTIAEGVGAPNSCSVMPNWTTTRQTINGYQVTVSHIPASDGAGPTEKLCAADADGLTVLIYTYVRHASPSAVSIFRRYVRILGPNPAGWTTEPLG
jgi:hypothetical protein